MTKTQFNITNESQDVSPLPAGDHRAAMNRRESMTNTRHNNKNDLQKKYRLGTVSKNILLESINQFHCANLVLVNMWIKTHRQADFVQRASLTVNIISVAPSKNIIQYVAKWYARKIIDHHCSVVPEKKSQPSGPLLSGILGKPRFQLELWALGLGFSCPH